MAATRAAMPCSAIRRGSQFVPRVSTACAIPFAAEHIVRTSPRLDRRPRAPISGNKKERVPAGTHSQKPTGPHPAVMRHPEAGRLKYSDLLRLRKGRVLRLTTLLSDSSPKL